MTGSNWALSEKDTRPGELPKAKDFGRHVHLREGAVPDPNPAYRGQRQRAMINTKTDQLMIEYSAGRLSEAAYHAGRTYQRVLERARKPVTGLGQWAPKDKVDVTESRDKMLLQTLANAQESGNMIAEIRNVVGWDGEKILTAVLGDGRTFRTVGETPRKWRLERKTRQLFNSSLERLASYWAIYGSYGLGPSE